VRAILETNHIDTHCKYALFLFSEGRLSYFKQCFSLLEAMGQYKREKKEVIKILSRSHENVKRRLEAAESKRSVAEVVAVPESILRKRLKNETVPTSLGHFKATYSSKNEK